MTKIGIVKNNEVVEVIELRSPPQRFIIYRGRLLEWCQVNPEEYLYMERSYLELY